MMNRILRQAVKKVIKKAIGAHVAVDFMKNPVTDKKAVVITSGTDRALYVELDSYRSVKDAVQDIEELAVWGFKVA